MMQKYPQLTINNYQQRRASQGAKTVIMILDYGISLTHVCGLEFFNFYIDTHSIQKRPLPLFLKKNLFLLLHAFIKQESINNLC